eukprot:1166130-Pyramimonas_sp.AAC.1
MGQANLLRLASPRRCTFATSTRSRPRSRASRISFVRGSQLTQREFEVLRNQVTTFGSSFGRPQGEFAENCCAPGGARVPNQAIHQAVTDADAEFASMSEDVESQLNAARA